MIFLILGTQKFQLNRLLKEMDMICEKGYVKDEVFAQVGYSDYRPKNYQFTNFLDKNEFEQKIRESSLIITHSGVGSIITSLKAGKPVIVYPRLSKYKEHVDDHQLEIAETFQRKNYVLCCGENDKLQDAILKVEAHEFNQYVSSTKRIISIINDFLLEVDR